jgi:hypothetical protein
MISFSNDPKSTTFTRYNFRLSRLLDITLLNIIEQNQQTFIEPNTPTQNIIRLQGLLDLPMSPLHLLSSIQVFKNQMFVNKINQRKIDQPFNSLKVNHHKQPDSMHNHNHGKVRFSFSKTHLFYSQIISFSNDPKSTTFTRYNFRLSRLLDIILLNIVEQNQQAFIETTTPTQNIIRLQGLFDLPTGPLHVLSFI